MQRKTTFDNCGTQTTELNVARHKKRFSVGLLYCNQWNNFSTKLHANLKYYIAKKHNAPNPVVTYRWKLWYQEFLGIQALRQQKNSQHVFAIEPTNVDSINALDGLNLKKELRSCKHFLADSELEWARRKVFNQAWESLNETAVNEKLDHFSTI